MEMWHGFKGDPRWEKPQLVASSDIANRADQGNEIKANEYLDTPAVFQLKIKMLADMLKAAKLCCAYTGAGLSRSSGIPDYATKAENSIVNNNNVPKLKSSLDALPTYAHCALTAMERAGYLHYFVQQNHDGLPQKSGFPQHKMNEIHGAWYDPSNPVVKFSGQLRDDLFKAMTKIEKKIDLCLCLGTSLSGMNADRVAETPARKSLSDPEILGTVIINIQQTRIDQISAIRIWGKLDDVFNTLAKELGLGEIKSLYKVPTKERIFHVPYNESGKYDPKCDMILDLSNNMPVYIPVKGAVNENAKGRVIGMKDNNFGYSIELQEGAKQVRRVFGVWWVYEAIEGKIPQLPLINVNPVVNKKL